MRKGPFVTDQSRWLVRTEIPRCSGGSLIRFSGFPLFEVQGSGFESKIKASFGIENMRGKWDAKKTLEITGLHEILSHRIEELYWGPRFGESCRPGPFLVLNIFCSTWLTSCKGLITNSLPVVQHFKVFRKHSFLRFFFVPAGQAAASL